MHTCWKTANPWQIYLGKAFVACTKRGELPIYAAIVRASERAKAESWAYYEIPTGHNLNQTMSHATAAILHKIESM